MITKEDFVFPYLIDLNNTYTTLFNNFHVIINNEKMETDLFRRNRLNLLNTFWRYHRTLMVVL